MNDKEAIEYLKFVRMEITLLRNMFGKMVKNYPKEVASMLTLGEYKTWEQLHKQGVEYILKGIEEATEEECK